MAATAWDREGTAERYAAFARDFPLYRETSRDLVRLAGLEPDAAVIDLACGTGATTREILAALGPDGTVTGVDGSAAMLAVARMSVTDERVAWVLAPAEELDQHVSGPATAVICNSAIWQTEFARTAAAVRAVLGAGGVFAFNVGAEFVRHDRAAEGDSGEASLTAAMQDIAAREFGWNPPGAGTSRRRRARLSQDEFGQVLGTAGFEVRHLEWLAYAESAEAQQAWLTVPVFTDWRLPGMAYQRRMAVLDLALQRLGQPEAAIGRWLAIVSAAV